MNIYLEKEKIFNHSITDNGLCVYAALRYFYKAKTTDYFVSINHLSYIMFERTGKRRDIEFIRDGLDNLIENNIVRVINKISSFEYILDLKGINYDIDSDGYYILISITELRSILSLKNIKKGGLLKYFLVICSSFNNSNSLNDKYKNKISKITIEKLALKSDIGQPTCVRYNELLEKSKLLMICRSVDTQNGGSNFYNYYCRYEDFELCKEFISLNNEDFNDFNSYANVNYNRGMAQKYNYLCKGKEYDIGTVKEIYNYCLRWNNIKMAEYKDNISKGFSMELTQKDMSVFKKYKFN